MTVVVGAVFTPAFSKVATIVVTRLAIKENELQDIACNPLFMLEPPGGFEPPTY